MSQKQSKVQLPPISQIGIVTHDVDKTADFYTRLGLGPFDVLELELDGFTYKGRPAPHKVKLGFSRGVPQIELIESIKGETPNSKFLKDKGEGVSHLQFQVNLDEYEEILSAWAEEGIQPVFYQDKPEMRIAYLDTGHIGGVMIELIGTKQKE